LYGGAKSFSDASKARNRGEAAQRAADKAIEEAKRRVDVNVYEQLSIAKEPYELMREAQLVQGATGLQAAVEGSSRGAAATAGRIQMAQGQQQAAIRAQQAQQMDALNKLVADEDARRQQQLAGIAMDEAAGAQLAARDAEEDRANYIAQGVGTLGSIAEGLSSSYAEGNFGQVRQGNADLRQSEGVASPDTRVGRRQMRQSRSQPPKYGDDFGFDQQFDITAPDPYVSPGMTNRELNQARRNERRALNQQRRDLGLSRDEFARRQAEAAAFVPREQEMQAIRRFDDKSFSYYRPSADRLFTRRVPATEPLFDPYNRVGSVLGDPNNPDRFDYRTMRTMTLGNSYDDLPTGPRPLPPGPPNLGQYSGLGFPSYLMYE
tara:strand:+ start:312 stop:1442 length:1131 start_codon:yes stop_codon:yes gene_type:complete